MKITKTLSILSVISCCIYIIAAFALAIFPAQVCMLFGMKKYMGINPDYVAHSITPPLPDEAYTIDHVYTVLHIAVIAFCLLLSIISALLILREKAKRLPVFLSWFSLLAFGISGEIIKTSVQYTLSSRGLKDTDFGIINSIHSFIMLFGFCGAVLCIIAAMHKHSKLSIHVLSIISICFSIFFLISRFIGFMPDKNNEYDKYYCIAAVIFIVLSILAYFGKIGRRNIYFATELSSAFPLGLQLLLMAVSGDYFGFLSEGQRNTISYLWLISGILCAVSSLKGAYENENT